MYHTYAQPFTHEQHLLHLRVESSTPKRSQKYSRLIKQFFELQFSQKQEPILHWDNYTELDLVQHDLEF